MKTIEQRTDEILRRYSARHQELSGCCLYSEQAFREVVGPYIRTAMLVDSLIERDGKTRQSMEIWRTVGTEYVVEINGEESTGDTLLAALEAAATKRIERNL